MENELQSISGTVDAVIYQNEENGYTILRLDCGEEERTAKKSRLSARCRRFAWARS